MKQIALSLIIILTSLASLAQTQVKSNDGIINNNNTQSQNYEAVTYRLFPTQNIWTFIKLNTRNGQMWQVQFDVKESNRFESILSLVPQVNKDAERNGRFTLYPTQNIYTFILLDQLGGMTWQVQWSAKAEERFVLPIF